jgi:flagellin
MSMSINTNTAALDGVYNLGRTTHNLEETQLRINTGLKVRGGKDNAALYAIAQNLRSDRSALEAVKRSVDRASSVMDVTIAAAESISDLLTRARELAVQVTDLGINADSRDAIALDYKNLMKQVDSQIQASEFNGTNLLKTAPDSVSAIISVNTDASVDSFGIAGYPLGATTATATESYASGTLDPTVGDNLAVLLSKRAIGSLGTSVKNGAGWHLANQLTTVTAPNAALDTNTGNISINTSATNYNAANGEITFTVGGTTFAATAQTNLPLGQNITLKPDQFAVKVAGAINIPAAVTKVAGTLDLTNFQDRMGSIAAVDNYHNKVKARISAFGSAARQLDMQRVFADKLSDSVDGGIGHLVDADLAAESAKLKALQVKQQLGTQTLSIANSAPQSILSLFQGG